MWCGGNFLGFWGRVGTLNSTGLWWQVPFVFHNSANYSFAPDELDLSAAMVRYWTSFARTSDPNSGNTATSVKWPGYNGTARMNLKLSVPISTE